jgi:hypothetical protein
MYKLSIIGSSRIVEEHIKVAIKAGFKIYSICSTNKKSKNLLKLKKKYKINKIFYDWKKATKVSSCEKKIAFLVAPRIKDTFKILKYICKFKKPVLVEKPVTYNLYNYKKLHKFSKLIFVGYNRLFYKNINFLKKSTKKIQNVIVKCPELNKKNILSNSCHIISILLYLFKEIKFYRKINNKNSNLIILKTKKNIKIFLFFLFESNSNFSVEFYEPNKLNELKPIEKLNIYQGFKLKKFRNNKNLSKFNLNLFKTIHEYGNEKFKPGFEDQIKAFMSFIKKNNKISNDIFFAENVMKICKKIL